MYNERHGKHQQPLPKLRNIRRACNKELYRTRKRLHGHIAPDKVKAAEEYYFKKVTETCYLSLRMVAIAKNSPIGGVNMYVHK